MDRESVTRKLVAAGLGVGVLHSYTAKQAISQGEVTLLHQVEEPMHTLFGYQTRRKHEPLLQVILSLLNAPLAS